MPLTATDETHVNAIVVKDEVMTMHLSAGFFS